jgi:glycosyltransferase involved in cell wall biosynthesis
MKKDKLSIAILGSRGIPNRYGGYEKCAQELGVRLVEKGHEVTVYCGSDHPVQDKIWHGIRREMIMNPEKRMGTAGQFIYDLNCNLDSRRKNFDIVLHLGYTSDSIWFWLWSKKSIHLVNMDGQEWKRSKFNPGVQRFLKYAEKLATKKSKYLIADSHPIENYLAEKYKNPIRYIAYGADIPHSVSSTITEAFGLESKKYDLMIARMEPENNVELAIEAKLISKDNIPLVIIGNSNEYKNRLSEKYREKQQIKFMDALYDPEKVKSLRYHSRYYIHGHSVGGTNPSLLEAMACSCVIFAHQNPFNKVVLGNDALFFNTKKTLADAFQTPISAVYQMWVSNNLEKIKHDYNWNIITEQYERLFLDAINLE